MERNLDALHPDYLKRKYGKRYRVYKGEDGVSNICKNFKPKNGLAFEVYVYGKGRLAVLLSSRMAEGLLRDFPDDLTLHQNANGAKVLLFKEEDLYRFSDKLRLRRRRRLSPEARERAAERLRPFHFKPHVTASTRV